MDEDARASAKYDRRKTWMLCICLAKNTFHRLVNNTHILFIVTEKHYEPRSS